MDKHICAGLLAHVDAGKTTLAEGILYTCGNLRKPGRVDHGDAFLDNFALERQRGITIFSKQAQVQWGELELTLLDTPGHVDFSAEMERTLQVLDAAILVISGTDGVQGHVNTLWRLLKQYGIPVFLFVNKMDLEGCDRERLMGELRSRLDERCVDFSKAVADGRLAPDSSDLGELPESFYENVAMCHESLLEEYLETGSISRENVAEAVWDRQLFPCFFGSALRLQGVEELLCGMNAYSLTPEYPEEFGARVFKIARDEAGNRLTWLKVTGGELRVKMPVSSGSDPAAGGKGFGSSGSGSAAGGKASGSDGRDFGDRQWVEKADQLRLYSGSQYQTTERVEAGGICAVTGLSRTFAGQGLGAETENEVPLLAPVLTYRLLLPEGADAFQTLGKLRQLEEEEPQLHLDWKESTGEIQLQVMGEVQLEILKSLILERFGLEVEFGEGSIVYKETLAEPVVGVGHYEPLRHYAEVHLLMEPGEPGSGLQFAALCSEDQLDRNWQRLVLTHLEEKKHLGVLTGSEITDMRILLIAGKAHLKHTEGGDFRQATYRAVRQGLRKSRSILLEPVFSFTLEVPTQMLGRAMSDIQRMQGSFQPPVTEGEHSILTGSGPVATFRDYQREVHAYTRGHGRFSCVLKGYEPCHNAQEVIAGLQYDPEADLANPTGSVFCAHGAGFVVDWDQVDEYAHVDSGWRLPESGVSEGAGLQDTSGVSAGGKSESEGARRGSEAAGMAGGGYGDTVRGFLVSEVRGGRQADIRKGTFGKNPGSASMGYITQEEIDAIFRQTYGKDKEDAGRYRRYHRGARRNQSGQSAGGSRGSQGAGSATGFRGDHAAAGDGTDGKPSKPSPKQSYTSDEHYFLVDGYNIIFAWPELRQLAAVNIDSARDKLMDILCNFQGYLGCTLILVFDAYKVKGNPGSVVKYHNIHVVYTREAETADQYIEKTVQTIARKYRVTVATSDALEQMIIWGSGALRMSAQGLKEAVEEAEREMREEYLKE